MKKFLVFLVAIITTVCIGVTFYQFAKNDEVIKINTQTIYINYGDKLSLDDLGFLRKEPSKETKIDFNAGGDEVTSIIKYDDLSGCYIPTSKGGATTIKITTTNHKYKSFNIDVMVGIGTEEFPYYISNEQQLFDITNSHIDENACFEVVRDIELTQIHTPIGFINNGYREFNGKFNGGYHKISNLQIDSCDYAGLFAIVGANSSICNLNFVNAKFNGSYINVGTVAGICYGSINKVVVSNPTINNNKTSSNTGSVVGFLQTDKLNNTTASILRTYAYTDNNSTISSVSTLGGIAGTVDSSIIHACHTDLNLKNTASGYTGGLVGSLLVNKDTYIRESYSISNIESSSTSGNIVGAINLSNTAKLSDISKELVLVGLYYENSNNSFASSGVDNIGLVNATSFAVNGKTSVEMKLKDTYVYYVNSANDVIYWDKVWYLVNGEYPTLTFISKFDDVNLDSDSDNISTNPDISNPETPNTQAILINNKEDLLNTFQTSNNVSGNYILNADIDLDGINWVPVSFTGSFKSSGNNNHTISNFTIVGDNQLYSGFFYNLGTATISNINFNNVKLTSTTANQADGILVGHIRGNVVIKNINISNAEISAETKYAGGITGYIDNIVKIEKCNVQNLTINNASNVGGIAGYSSNDTYIVSSKLKTSNTLSGIDRVGGIVAVNHGTVYNCSVVANINSISTSNAGYFGGIVGVNYSTILDSATFAEITIINPNTNNSNYYYVGGLTAYNLGKISNSTANAEQYSAKQSSGVVYIAGLTAYNSGTIEYCVADIKNIGSVDNNIYTAGLSLFNYGGTIFGCFAFGNLNGYQVAGLVRTNTNNGTIDSCMASLNDLDRATYKGVQLASFVYDITSGTISNCLVNADLHCSNNDGWIAGFAGFMSYTNGKFGTISHSIANVSFNGLGTKYLDIAQYGLLKSSRTTGTITNCIINEEANTEESIRSEYSKILWIEQNPGSESNYSIINSTDLLNIETYLNPTIANFSISTGLTGYKWLYINNTRLPIPSTYLDVFGYDIIELG